MRRTTRRLVLDIETEPFSPAFRSSKDLKSRTEHAPAIRVVGVFDELDNKYCFYTQRTRVQLRRHLAAADELITYNGEQFDLPVLQKHFGPRFSLPKKCKHVDLFRILSDRAGFWVSLDCAVQVNFGERKHTAGRQMLLMSLAELKAACRSDVAQTYRLWKAYRSGRLKCPDSSLAPRRHRLYSYVFANDDCFDGPGEHMPEVCPICGDVGSLELLEEDVEEMTEGQMADYMAGVQGCAHCMSCRNVVFWQL